MSQKKPSVLYILHCYNNRGGVEEHTKALEASLGEDFDIYLAYPEANKVYLRENNVLVADFPGETPPWPICPYNIPLLEHSISAILERVKPKLIHVQHFLNWHLGLLDQLASYCEKNSSKIVLSFHEYFAITPHFTMQFIDNPRQAYSKEYASAVFGTDISDYLIKRREILVQSFAKMKRLIVPSKFLALELAKVFPWEYQVIEHGIAPFPRLPVTKSESLRFGYLGALIPQKGSQVALEAFEQLKPAFPKSELHLFGSGASLPENPPPGIFFHGKYSNQELGEIMSSFDIGIIPSIFKETHCYVLSEMQYAGKPVVLSKIGALGERATEGENAKFFSPGDSKDAARAMTYFLEHNDWRSWSIPKPRMLSEMTSDYKRLYQELLAKR